MNIKIKRQVQLNELALFIFLVLVIYEKVKGDLNIGCTFYWYMIFL